MDENGLENIDFNELSFDIDDMFEEVTTKADMKEDYKLIIVGTKFVVVNKKTLNIVETTIAAAKSKFGKSIYEEAPFYEGYSNEADNINYKLFNGKFVNSNVPLPYVPKKGKWPTIDKMLRHVCGTQYDMMLQYYSNMIRYPAQRLPLVLLLSMENNTGKTTLVEWTAKMLGDNAMKIRSLDISSQFSGYYTDKQFAYIDEALEGAHKYQDISVLKDMITADVISSEIKGQAKRNVINNLKIMMCSNDVYNAIAMEGNDTRVWPIKVPVMKKGHEEDKDTFKNKLDAETPAFLHFIINEYKLPPSRGRLYFSSKEIENELKLEIKEESRPDVVKIFLEILDTLFEEDKELDKIECTSYQIKQVTKSKLSLNRIHSIFVAEGIPYLKDDSIYYVPTLLKLIPPFTYRKKRGSHFTFPRKTN